MHLLKDIKLQIILYVVALATMGNNLVAPLLPSMIQSLGVSPETIGFVLSSFTIMVALVTPLGGMLSDRFGRRAVLIPALFIYAGAGMLIPLTANFPLILGLRALQGVGVAAMVSLAVVMLGDLYEGPDRVTAIGFRSSVHSLSSAAAPLVAGVIGLLSWSAPFYLYGLSAVVGVMAIFKLKVPEVRNTARPMDYLRDIGQLVVSRQYAAVLYYSFHIFVIVYFVLAFVPLFLDQEFGFSSFAIGAYVFLFYGLSALVSSQIRRLLGWFSPPVLVHGGFLLSGIALVLFPVIGSATVLVAVLTVWAVGYGVAFPTIYNQAINLAPPQLRAGMVSLVMMTTYLGCTVTPPAFSAVLKFSNLDWVFISGGIVAMAPAFLVLAGRLRREKAPQA